MKYNKIGIICAMEKEAEGILSAMEEKESHSVGSLAFYTGRIGEKEVVLAICGIGKVFAAMCAEAMTLSFRPQCIITSGVAGSLTEKLDILSLAVSESLVQHDMDTSPLGDPIGLISGINKVFLPADKPLAQEVLRLAEEEKIPAAAGVIASGDRFIAKEEDKMRLKTLFDPIACEMEGAAIAQVCFANKIPFCVIRTISDSFHGDNAMDYAEFSRRAALQGAQFLVKLLKK
ncbi:MAG: 5'-methylthioadenosine/adenosylhomocysteine nucleosidase [Clostridia bacterium]|nr:5'-methylthioadenosine/adenosylhomocysteine nucleosidase [Clostridia bacterium]